MKSDNGDTPADRVREHIRRWLETTGLSQEDFAATVKEGGKKDWLASILQRKNDVRLRDLDHFADAMRTTASELVRTTAERYQLELTPTEVRVLERLRRKPELLEALMVLLELRTVPPTAPNSGTKGSRFGSGDFDKSTKTLRLRSD